MARGTTGLRGRAAGGRPVRTARLGRGTVEARHPRDHPAGRALGTRPGHHRPARLAFPDTDRLRNVAWLAHRTLPYALSVAGEEFHPVHCELTSPDGEVWRYGPDDANSAIIGTAGAFCRVAARRLHPAESGLHTIGPHAATALTFLRKYAA